MAETKLKNGMQKAGKEAGEPIDLAEKTTVYATKNAPYHEEGEEISVHPKLAEHFIEKGFATAEAKGKNAASKDGK